MEEKEVILTKEGYNKLEEQLNFLKTTKRTEIAERIKVARGFGDLSEIKKSQPLIQTRQHRRSARCSLRMRQKTSRKSSHKCKRKRSQRPERKSRP